MNSITADEIKRQARTMGADLCGIAAVDRFAEAPPGFHPTDVLASCRSVIVLAVQFPHSTLMSSSQAAYTFVRNRTADKMDAITFQLATGLEALGGCAVAIPSTDPYDYWDDGRRHGQGILSLKHAAVRAGLGQMGKNTLLVNEKFGNMLWLGAVLLDRVLSADAPVTDPFCSPECRICLDSCPAQALDGISIVQRKCREIASKYTEGGGGIYACNLCRKICPHCKGVLR